MIPLLTRLSTGSWFTAFCVLATSIEVRPAKAQVAGASTAVMLGGGMSFASPSTDGGGLTAHAGVRHQRENLMFSFWAGQHHGGFGSGPIAGPGRAKDRFDEIAVLAGYAVHRSENSLVALSSGIAFLGGERVGTGPAPHSNETTMPIKKTVGIPLQMTISGPGGSSGLGITAHANLNVEAAIVAVTVTYLMDLGYPR